MSPDNYQTEYTKVSTVAKKSMFDSSGRQQKADKILSVIRDYYGNDNKLSMASILDMSCSTGMMAKTFSTSVGQVTGIDIDNGAVSYAKKHNSGDNIEYIEMDALYTSFQPDSFDIIICNQMYEHVPDSTQLMNEIHRVLKKGGICYFGATNRLKIIETHYGNIPFLSYFPKFLANKYLQLIKKGDYYYENLYTYWGLRALSSQFTVIDYTRKIIAEPDAFGASDILKKDTLKYYFANTVSKLAYPLLPGYVWLLVKE